MGKKYIVRLSVEEREIVLDVIKKLKGTSQKVRRAHILLKADADGPNWTDRQIAGGFVKRLEFHYTPKHGSWLNIAENELSAMTRQCLSNRRIGSREELQKETAAWAASRNAKQRGVDWQFTIDDARTKLKSLYPNLVE